MLKKPIYPFFLRFTDCRHSLRHPLSLGLVGMHGSVEANRALGKDIIVSDVGQHQMILARFYNFQIINSWFNSGGADTMGCTLPMSVGVKLARPDERVWTVCRDGGFQMNI